jgi:beta-aspartyl-dipeptidase (metallo-type)
MLTLIENGELFAPEPMGLNSILLGDGKILKIGKINRRAVEDLDIGFEAVDAADCVVVPGFIDPHEHLLGGSGEKGFASQTPEIYPRELIEAGITAVVGCLGVDTTMKTMAGLLAKAKALNEEGLSAYIWTGGYDVPPTTITNSVRNDVLFITEIIGAGEIAISDERSTDHVPHELARLVIDTHNGGMLARKAGATHFHVGDGEGKLQPLRTLLDEFDVIKPEWLYPTHVERSEALMLEAIELTKRGSFVDIDTVEKDLAKWLKFYFDNGGKPEQLTISSDASITSPRNVFEQIRECVLEHQFPLETVLPLVTSNTARVLKLGDKGTIEAGKAADVLILKRDTLEITDVFAGGRQMMKQGKLVVREKFLAESNRRVEFDGEKF